MNKFLLFLCFLTTVSFGQLPIGINPSTVSKADLDKYGVSESDLRDMINQYQTTQPAQSTPVTTVVEVQQPDVEIEKKVTPIDTPKEALIDSSDNSVYGKSFFNSSDLKLYEAATHVKASPNYILGTGDELSVSIWGYSEHSGVYTIGDDGAISPRLVGKIYLKGQSYDKATKIIEAKFGKVYDLKNSQISIELNYSKVIRVNIVGEVNKPGTYTIPAINPIFNVLSVAGGITKNGTVRNIEIRREGKTIKVLDVYQFMLDPSYNSSLFLLDNDYIVVGTANSVVELKGSVVRPHRYELKAGEGIKELIDYAGGFLPSSYTKRLNLYRYKDNRDEIIELNYQELRENNKTFPLQNGDRVIVSSVPSEIRNRVTIEGEVNIPGSFVFKQGMLVKELVENSEGLTMEAFTDKAFIYRINPDYTSVRLEVNLAEELSGKSKTKLQEFDVLTVYSKKDFLNNYQVNIVGAVKIPSNFAYSRGLTLGDLIFMAGGILPQAYLKRIEISRVNKTEDGQVKRGRTVVEVVEIEGDLLSKKNQEIFLEPNDVVYVRALPDYSQQSTVTISGEVNFPGDYVIESKNQKITDIIKRAGGITEWAFLEGAYLTRKSGDLGGRLIVFDLKDLLEKNKDEYDYYVKEGDVIVIPELNNFVMLAGAVDFPKVQQAGSILVPYFKNKRAKYFINKYGSGFAKNAKRSKTYVETPGGQVKRTKNYGLFRVYPKVENGDIIHVLEKEKKEKEKKEEKPVDWNRAIENLTVKLTGLATLYIILSTALSN